MNSDDRPGASKNGRKKDRWFRGVSVFCMLMLLGAMLFFLPGTYLVHSDVEVPLDLSIEERSWLDQNMGKEFVLGLDPDAGIESFAYGKGRSGYLYEFSRNLKKELGIRVVINDKLTWNQAMEGLKRGTVHIVAGANRNQERLGYMEFSRPIHSVPYVIMSRKDSNYKNLGDINGGAIAFIRGDSIIGRISEKYTRVSFKAGLYESNQEAIKAVLEGKQDALIITGGPVVYDYVNKNPELKKVCDIEPLQSEMSLAGLKENGLLISVLDKYIARDLKSGRMEKMTKAALRTYIQSVLALTEEEREWIKKDGKVIVGVTQGYLPFDYLKDGDYAGISGAVWNELADLMGLQSIYVEGEFSKLYNQLLKGGIHVLNVAKTDGREDKMYFPMPYLNERDRIYGKIDTPSVFDIAGLKDKTVAVIPDYYQADMLEKNQTGAKLAYFDSLEKCIKAVHSGKADYMIENPQVMSYYTGEMGIYDLAEKGITTTDTRLYFGVSLDQPELASIMNKVIPILDNTKDLEKGLQSVPRRKNIEKYTTLLEIIIALLLLLLIIGWVLSYLFRQLVQEKTEKELLASKETILYTDRLTGLYNRNYYNDRIRPVMDEREFPQAIIVFDLNNLKEVNDNYGHHVGDQLLEAFGAGLSKAAPGSLGVRLGGDEFVLFMHGLPATTPHEVIEAMERISLEEPVTIADTKGICYSFAKGFSIREHKGVSLNEMFREADQKMYADKNYRKNKPGNSKPGNNTLGG